MAFPPTQPGLCWYKAELGSSLGPTSGSASLARRRWVDPFRTEVYSGEFSFFCKILSAGTGINKETRLLPAPVLPSLLPWAPAGWCAGSVPWGQRGGQSCAGCVPPSPGGARTDRGPDPEPSSPGASLCSLALPAPPGMVLSSTVLSCPEGCSRLRWCLAISLMTVRLLCSLSSSCQRWDGRAAGRGFASLC